MVVCVCERRRRRWLFVVVMRKMDMCFCVVTFFCVIGGSGVCVCGDESCTVNMSHTLHLISYQYICMYGLSNQNHKQ